MDFQSKVILITGGAGGIGSELCKKFASLGATVVAADIDETRLSALESHANENSVSIVTELIDLGDSDATESFMKKLFNVYGEKLCIIVNNVASGGFGDFLNSRTSDWDKAMDVGLRSAYITSREFGKFRKKNDIKTFGRIINIASSRHVLSEPNGEINAAVKGGLSFLTSSSAVSLNRLGITVNSLSLGLIITGGKTSVQSESGSSRGKAGSTGDVANACLFLCDENNDIINGQDFVIDGGFVKF